MKEHLNQIINMNGEEHYWKNIMVCAKNYHSALDECFQNTTEDKLIPYVKESLLDRHYMYYAMQLVEQFKIETKIALLKELVHICIWGKEDIAYRADKILLSINSQTIRKIITDYLKEHEMKNPNDDDVIKLIADLLCDLRYKQELIDFVNKHLDSLKRSEFIEDDNDIKDINDMEDFSEYSPSAL